MRFTCASTLAPAGNVIQHSQAKLYDITLKCVKIQGGYATDDR